MATLRLSEAILLGSTTGPQTTRVLFGDGDSTCAMGAAYKAIGAREFDAMQFWPWLTQKQICPACGKCESRTTYIITNHLNDTHEWTREQIAEWVAKVEPDEPIVEESGADIRKSQGISNFALNQSVTGNNWNG